MSADVLPVQLVRFHCRETPAFSPCEPQPKEDVQHTPHKEFINVMHAVVRVGSRPESPQPTNKNIPVTVFDGSTGTKVPLVVKSTDTIGKLTRAFIKKRPHMKGNLNLTFNGKPVNSEKTLRELGVKPGATFVTYQRCIGG